jgi:hypothetical protein
MTKGVCSLACWYDTVVASLAAGKAGPLPVCLAIAGIVKKEAEEYGGGRTDQARKFITNMDIIGVQDGHHASCLAGTFVFFVIFSTSSSVWEARPDRVNGRSLGSIEAKKGVPTDLLRSTGDTCVVVNPQRQHVRNMAGAVRRAKCSEKEVRF